MEMWKSKKSKVFVPFGLVIIYKESWSFGYVRLGSLKKNVDLTRNPVNRNKVVTNMVSSSFTLWIFFNVTF